MAPKSVTFRRHDHLVSVLFEDLLSHSYNITFLDLVEVGLFSSLCTPSDTIYEETPPIHFGTRTVNHAQ